MKKSHSSLSAAVLIAAAIGFGSALANAEQPQAPTPPDPMHDLFVKFTQLFFKLPQYPQQQQKGSQPQLSPAQHEQMQVSFQKFLEDPQFKLDLEILKKAPPVGAYISLHQGNIYPMADMYISGEYAARIIDPKDRKARAKKLRDAFKTCDLNDPNSKDLTYLRDSMSEISGRIKTSTTGAPDSVDPGIAPQAARGTASTGEGHGCLVGSLSVASRDEKEFHRSLENSTLPSPAMKIDTRANPNDPASQGIGATSAVGCGPGGKE